MDDLADFGEQLAEQGRGALAAGGDGGVAGPAVAHEAADANHEELVVVGAGDGDELQTPGR